MGEGELQAALRDLAYEELEREADLAASFARSIGEAAFRGDALTLAVHLRQLRDVVRAMIETYKKGVERGQGMAEEND